MGRGECCGARGRVVVVVGGVPHADRRPSFTRHSQPAKPTWMPSFMGQGPKTVSWRLTARVTGFRANGRRSVTWLLLNCAAWLLGCPVWSTKLPANQPTPLTFQPLQCG